MWASTKFGSVVVKSKLQKPTIGQEMLLLEKHLVVISYKRNTDGIQDIIKEPYHQIFIDDSINHFVAMTEHCITMQFTGSKVY